MADAKDIPAGTYAVQLGSSFADDSRRKANGPSYHTLRYDFKPSSVTNDTESYMSCSATGDVHVALPTEGDNLTVFKGSKKDAKPKECLLFLDKRTGTVRLEKITSSMNVKKTRDLDANTEAALRNGIEKLRANKKPKSNTPAMNEKESDSSSSSSGSGSESDSSDDDDDGKKASGTESGSGSDIDENHLLEEMNNSKLSTAKTNAAPIPEPAFQSMPSFDLGKSHSQPKARKGQADLGLTLSESSDED